VKITLFSVDEANRALPAVRPALELLVKTKREHDRVLRQIDALTLALSGASPNNPDTRARRDLIERRRHLAEKIQRGVETIQARGCVVKDLERGLIDFYSVAGDRLIYLCWQLGESEVSHWHTLEGGFSSRQPLNRTELE